MSARKLCEGCGTGRMVEAVEEMIATGGAGNQQWRERMIAYHRRALQELGAGDV